MENCPFIVDVPIKNGGSFQFANCKRFPEGTQQRKNLVLTKKKM